MNAMRKAIINSPDVASLEQLSSTLRTDLTKFQRLANSVPAEDVLPLLLEQEITIINQLMDAQCQFLKSKKLVN